MNDAPNTALVANPFGGAPVVASAPPNMGGFVSVEQQRAVAEVQAHMLIARATPRDPRKAMDLILNECQIPAFAEDAQYQYARGGTDISGPSIKLVEGVARNWGNIRSGIREISRQNGASEVIAEAWDLQTGYYDFRQFQVRHWRDTKQGGKPITDERDIYELIANMGQRRKRAVLMAIIPQYVFDTAVEQCNQTLKAKADTSPEGLKKLLDAFAQFGVSQTQIEARIQRRLDAITPAMVVGLKRVYASLRDEMSVPGDWFDPVPASSPPPPPLATGAQTTESGTATQGPAPEPTPAPKSGKGAKLREKLQAKDQSSVVQKEGQGAGDGVEGAKLPVPATSSTVATDAGSTPAAGSPDMVAMKYLDFKSAIEESDGDKAHELVESARAIVDARTQMPIFTDQQLAKLQALADAKK